ncbi:helix-turn-helix transcriptional regulator [Actinomadura fulvescens]|uniref:XRE family transcriptional regulator n=1 Tax=Actinomadura fulvescens TaxID=46160 RepID=A0ABP6C1R6_9ACTN
MTTAEDRVRTGQRLREEREKRGWGKRRMARELLKAIGAPPERKRVDSLDRQMLEWEKGKHYPEQWASAYATAFEMDEAELFPELRRGSVDESEQSREVDDDVKRRAALQLLAALSAGTAISTVALDEVLADIEHAALGDGRVDLGRWDQAVWEYGQSYISRPAGSMVDDLTADIIAIGRLLSRAQPPLMAAGLLRVSAGLSGLLAMEFNAMGERRAARTAWGAAARAADASGDRDLAVWVRAKEADGALWAGAPLPIVAALVNEAITAAQGRPSHGLARAHTVRADLAAEQGDRNNARAALRDLAYVLERVPEDVTADPSGHVGEAFLRWHEAYVYALLGDEEADRSLDRGLDLLSHSRGGASGRSSGGSLHLIRSMGLVTRREVGAGLDSALTTLGRAHYIDPATRRHLSGQILRCLPDTDRNLPAARELRALTV